MTSTTRSVRLLPLAASLLVASCGFDPFGAPPRVGTHGYQAKAEVVVEGTTKGSFEIAVRGGDVRVVKPGPASWPVLVVRDSGKRAFELDPATKSVRDADPAPLSQLLPGHPLEPGFSSAAEASARGLTSYARESDAVFAGMACELWRFDDDPKADVSSATTYWVAPSLDRLVVRRDRDEVVPGGGTRRTTTQLLAIRPGAPASLFEVPEGYRKTAR